MFDCQLAIQPHRIIEALLFIMRGVEYLDHALAVDAFVQYASEFTQRVLRVTGNPAHPASRKDNDKGDEWKQAQAECGEAHVDIKKREQVAECRDRDQCQQQPDGRNRRSTPRLAFGQDEIGEFIGGLTSGAVPEGQAAAFAMAVFFRGLTRDERVALTRAMTKSGDASRAASNSAGASP